MVKGSANSSFLHGRLLDSAAEGPLAKHAGVFVPGVIRPAAPLPPPGRADLHLPSPRGELSQPALRLRALPEQAISLVAQGLAARREIVPPQGNLSRGYRVVKRLLDVLGALALLVLFSPIMITVWLVLLITTRGKPIFCQTRLGYCGRPFRMYKFRTMLLDAEWRQDEVANDHDGPIFKNRRDPRTTRLGRLLRVSSIDETPQLLNVLAGQMSLVGPRPPLAEEVAQYKAWQLRRLAVKPGLTCLWQVSGRSDIGFVDWVRMDLRYVRSQGLATDLQLLARTPWSVLNRRGAY